MKVFIFIWLFALSAILFGGDIHGFHFRGQIDIAAVLFILIFSFSLTFFSIYVCNRCEEYFLKSREEESLRLSFCFKYVFPIIVVIFLALFFVYRIGLFLTQT